MVFRETGNMRREGDDIKDSWPEFYRERCGYMVHALKHSNTRTSSDIKFQNFQNKKFIYVYSLHIYVFVALSQMLFQSGPL